MGQTARVAAHIGVMNEVSMIDPCLAHLRRIGIEDILVFDLGSTDGTRDLLADRKGGGLRVVDFPASGTDKMLMEAAQTAIDDSPADWCLLMDADEFPLPRGGDIGAAFEDVAADLIELPRYNVVLGPAGLTMPLPPEGPQDYGQIDLFVDPRHSARPKIEADPTLAWLRVVPAPKIAVRAGRTSGLVRGMHNAHPRPGQTLRRLQSRDLLLAHAALTDFPRFEQKIASIRFTLDTFGKEMSKKFGWHWRRWLELEAAGQLRAEYDRSYLTAEDLAALRQQGVVASAAKMLTAPPPRARKGRAKAPETTGLDAT